MSETIAYSGLPDGTDILVISLIFLGEMTRYIFVILVSGLFITSGRAFWPGIIVLFTAQFLVTEYRYSGVEGLGLYGIRIVSDGSVTL